MRSFKLNRPSTYSWLPSLPVVERGRSIPKILHQTNSSRPWPEIVEQNVAQLRRSNPDWEYRFYDHDERRAYIELHYGINILTYYDRIDPLYGAAQADLFRYLALYREGGVYLDIKSGSMGSLTSNIDLDAEFIIGKWPNRKGDVFDRYGIHPELETRGTDEFQQWNIICAPGHPFLKAAILAVLRNIDVYNPLFHETGKPGVLRVTGPIAYTLAIHPLLGTSEYSLRLSEDLGLFYSIFAANGLGDQNHVNASHYRNNQGIPVIKAKFLTASAFNLLRAGKRAVFPSLPQ